MEGLLKTRDDGYGQLQRLHEEQLNKLSAATHGQTQTWQQQKQQIEEHYSQLLTEIHSRHKVLVNGTLLAYIIHVIVI